MFLHGSFFSSYYFSPCSCIPLSFLPLRRIVFVNFSQSSVRALNRFLLHKQKATRQINFCWLNVYNVAGLGFHCANSKSSINLQTHFLLWCQLRTFLCTAETLVNWYIDLYRINIIQKYIFLYKMSHTFVRWVRTGHRAMTFSRYMNTFWDKQNNVNIIMGCHLYIYL